MPRPIWRGAVSFGMVSIPVRLYTATENKDIAFRQLTPDGRTRVRQIRIDPDTGEEVPYEEIVRGYEYAKDQFVVLEPEDFDQLPVPSKHTISLDSFVELADVDPVYFEKAYYLEPDEVGMKPFALLVRAMEDQGLAAIGRLSLRNKERLCALRPLDGRLMVETLYYPDEIRVTQQEPLALPEVSEQELTMAHALIEMLHAEFQPDEYHDAYRARLMELIEAKLAGRELETPEAAEAPNVVDLMTALRASVEAARRRRDDGGAAAAGDGGEADGAADGEAGDVSDRQAAS